MASNITVDTLTKGATTLNTDEIVDKNSKQACKAWVNFDGTTNTAGNCTIRAEHNVSSVTDTATGRYKVNFTTAMTDANYSAAITTQGNGTVRVDYGFGGSSSSTLNTAYVPVEYHTNFYESTIGWYDTPLVCVQVFST